MSTPNDDGMFSVNGTGSERMSSIPLRDVDPEPSQASIGSLVRQASEQVSTLVRSEIALAKTEISAQVKRGLVGTGFFAAAALFAFTSILPFIFFWAKLFSMWLGTKSWDWAGFLIVFVLMLLMAVVLVLLGWFRVRKLRAPDATIKSVKDLKKVLPTLGSHESTPPSTGTTQVSSNS